MGLGATGDTKKNEAWSQTLRSFYLMTLSETFFFGATTNVIMI